MVTAQDVRLLTRFCAKVQFGKPGQCWIWTGATYRDGYGMIGVRGRLVRAHRLAYVIAFRKRIPTGLHVLHTCDTPRCVNPMHLVLGTAQDNVRDRDRKGRRIIKLTWNQVQWIRKLSTRRGFTQRRIAKLYGISQSQISNIVRGHQWNEKEQAS